MTNELIKKIREYNDKSMLERVKLLSEIVDLTEELDEKVLTEFKRLREILNIIDSNVEFNDIPRMYYCTSPNSRWEVSIDSITLKSFFDDNKFIDIIWTFSDSENNFVFDSFFDNEGLSHTYVASVPEIKNMKNSNLTNLKNQIKAGIESIFSFTDYLEEKILETIGA